MNKNERTKRISNLITSYHSFNRIDYKALKIGHHTSYELYDRIRVLVCLCATALPKLSFASLKHNLNEKDEMYNGDFMVGFYTPLGPAAFHIKNDFINEFSNLKFTLEGPLLDKNDHENRMLKLESLKEKIGNNVDVDTIIREINGNEHLEESQKVPLKQTYVDIKEVEPEEKNNDNLDPSLSKRLETVISVSRKNNLINYKEINIVWNKIQDLFDYIRELVCIFTTIYPELSFISEKHFDEENDPMHDGDFIVGFYTSIGPLAFHFKNEFKDCFEHLIWDERGPKYDFYDHNGFMKRMESLISDLSSGLTIDDIIDKINKTAYLDKSQKPKKNKYKRLI